MVGESKVDALSCEEEGSENDNKEEWDTFHMSKNLDYDPCEEDGGLGFERRG